MTSLRFAEGFRFVGGLDGHAHCSLSSTLARSWAVPGTERMISGWMGINASDRWMRQRPPHGWRWDTTRRGAQRTRRWKPDERTTSRNLNEKRNAEGRPMKKSMAGGGVPLSGARKAVRCLNIDGLERSAVVEKGPSWSIAVGARGRERGGEGDREERRLWGQRSFRSATNQQDSQGCALHFISSRRLNLVLVTNISIFLFKFGLFWAENGEIHHMCIKLVSSSTLSLRMCVVLFVRLGCERFGGLALFVRYWSVVTLLLQKFLLF